MEENKKTNHSIFIDIVDATDIYKMPLFTNGNYHRIWVTRVPNGWIIDGVFVPYNEEFKPKEVKQKEAKSEYYPIGYMGVDFQIAKKILEDASLLRHVFRRYYIQKGRPQELKDIAEDFLSYWETKDKSGKMAFEKEPKFNLPLRIKTWKQNNQNKQQKETEVKIGITRTEI